VVILFILAKNGRFIAAGCGVLPFYQAGWWICSTLPVCDIPTSYFPFLPVALAWLFLPFVSTFLFFLSPAIHRMETNRDICCISVGVGKKTWKSEDHHYLFLFKLFAWNCIL
jgi:hypothetical protein